MKLTLRKSKFSAMCKTEKNLRRTFINQERVAFEDIYLFKIVYSSLIFKMVGWILPFLLSIGLYDLVKHKKNNVFLRFLENKKPSLSWVGWTS
jgi:hypothetical protein